MNSLKNIFEKNKFIILIFIFSVIVMLIDLHNGYIKGHDTDFHLSNITAIVEQLSWNNLIVQEPLKYIGNGFGYGTRFFYPPLPHLTAAYITKFLTLFNINNVAIGMRVTQWLTIFTSGLTFYILCKKIFKNNKTATILSVFYMTAPYHLSEIFIRDAFSEMFIPIAIPLIILGLLQLVEKNYKQFFICFILGYTLAIYSHLAMTIYFTLMILVTFFIVYFKEIFTKKNILYLILASILILLLTSSFWMPLFEMKIEGNYGVFIPYYMTGKGDLRFSTISILELFAFFREFDYHYIRYNLQLPVTIMFFASLIIIIKKKMWKEKIWIFLFVFTLLSIIMVTSLFPWYYTPDILQTLQFPWRLAIYIAFGAILMAGICLKQIENKKYFNIIWCILIILAVFSTWIYIDHLEESNIDITNINNEKSMGNQAEYLPEKTLNNRDYFNNRTSEIIILDGLGEIYNTLDDVPNLTFEADVSETMTIELPRIYYMGYSLKINNNNIELTESDNGFLQATITESGTYTLTYEKTFIMKFANIISLLTLLFSIIVILRIKNSNFSTLNH
jgi:hypothetical protein